MERPAAINYQSKLHVFWPKTPTHERGKDVKIRIFFKLYKLLKSCYNARAYYSKTKQYYKD